MMGMVAADPVTTLPKYRLPRESTARGPGCREADVAGTPRAAGTRPPPATVVMTPLESILRILPLPKSERYRLPDESMARLLAKGGACFRFKAAWVAGP